MKILTEGKEMVIIENVKEKKAVATEKKEKKHTTVIRLSKKA